MCGLLSRRQAFDLEGEPQFRKLLCEIDRDLLDGLGQVPQTGPLGFCSGHFCECCAKFVRDHAGILQIGRTATQPFSPSSVRFMCMASPGRIGRGGAYA